jgi:hypothetical protein
MEKLWELIKKLEEPGGITDCYLHHNYETGDLELNIEFDRDIAHTDLEGSNIRKINSCAYWEE